MRNSDIIRSALLYMLCIAVRVAVNYERKKRCVFDVHSSRQCMSRNALKKPLKIIIS